MNVNEYYKNNCSYTLYSLNRLSRVNESSVYSDVDQMGKNIENELSNEIKKMNLENYRSKLNYIKAKYNYNKKVTPELDILKKLNKKSFLQDIKEGLISCKNIGQALVAPNPDKKTK